MTLPVPTRVYAREGLADTALRWLGSAIDAIALQGMSLAYGDALHGGPSCAAPQACDPYRDPELQVSPRRFFSFLDTPAIPELLYDTVVARVPGGRVHELRFRSAYEPYGDAGRALRARWPENEIVTVRHWRHDDRRGRATVLALHGFGMGGSPWADARILCAAEWFARGLDVALLVLPLHGVRCPADAAYSGTAFGSWTVAHLNEAVRESVHDAERTLRWLEQASGAAVGVLGLSLGGYLAALLAGLSTRPAFVVPVVPPVLLGDLPMRLYALRHGDAPPPLSPDECRDAYRVHSPLTYPLAIERRRVMIVAGSGDRFVPPAQPHALWLHWGRPAIHWFSGGHLTPFGRSRIVERVARHLEALDLVEPLRSAA
jgi:hypothetical protein